MIDWNKFAERVPVGTHVRAYNTLGVEIIRHGILLANTPCFEEHVARVCDKGDSFEAEYMWCERNPFLRFQDFGLAFEDKFLPLYTYAQYLIDGQWLTFNEVMR